MKEEEALLTAVIAESAGKDQTVPQKNECDKNPPAVEVPKETEKVLNKSIEIVKNKITGDELTKVKSPEELKSEYGSCPPRNFRGYEINQKNNIRQFERSPLDHPGAIAILNHLL